MLRGRGGKDQLRGGGGNDKLYGDAGKDVLVGGGGRDRLTGGTGNDRMFGGAGNDDLRGQDSAAPTTSRTVGPGRRTGRSADPATSSTASCEKVTQNDPSTAVTLTPSEVAENQPTGTLVGQLPAVDPDPGDNHEFELVTGSRLGRQRLVHVDGDKLLTDGVLDFEADHD